MFEFGLTIICLCVLGLIRNELVSRIRGRRLREIHQLNVREIDAGIVRFTERYREFDDPSYEAMLLDLRKWTYKQFYKELE